jgi:hypothetical protein
MERPLRVLVQQRQYPEHLTNSRHAAACAVINVREQILRNLPDLILRKKKVTHMDQGVNMTGPPG